jgi:hypothetical protein
VGGCSVSWWWSWTKTGLLGPLEQRLLGLSASLGDTKPGHDLLSILPGPLICFLSLFYVKAFPSPIPSSHASDSWFFLEGGPHQVYPSASDNPELISAAVLLLQVCVGRSGVPKMLSDPPGAATKVTMKVQQSPVALHWLARHTCPELVAVRGCPKGKARGRFRKTVVGLQGAWSATLPPKIRNLPGQAHTTVGLLSQVRRRDHGTATGRV